MSPKERDGTQNTTAQKRPQGSVPQGAGAQPSRESTLYTLQRARLAPDSISADDVQRLQRTVGNQRTIQFLNSRANNQGRTDAGSLYGPQAPRVPLLPPTTVPGLRPAAHPQVVQRDLTGQGKGILTKLSGDDVAYEALVTTMKESKVYTWHLPKNAKFDDNVRVYLDHLMALKAEWQNSPEAYAEVIKHLPAAWELKGLPGQEIEHELKTDFPAVADTELMTKAIAVAQFLADQGRVTAELEKLEAALRRRLDAEMGARAEPEPQPEAVDEGDKGKEEELMAPVVEEPENPVYDEAKTYYKELQDHYKRPKYKDKPSRGRVPKKLFTKEMTAFEQGKYPESDLRNPENPKAHLINNFLETEAFRKLITEGVPMKDVGAAGGHGEFTHRLQWYLIGTSGIVAPRELFELYKLVGTTPYMGGKVEEDKQGQRSLWDAVVDRDEKTADFVPWKVEEWKKKGEVTLDARSPTNLNQYIIEGLQKCPLLSAMFAARATKRKKK